MVFENDPFEDFKRQRQVELIEQNFRTKAEKKSKKLHDLVRKGQGSSELASRINEEMQEFFNESKQHISSLINEADHPDSSSIEEKVQDEMADFFRESTETAQHLLQNMCNPVGDPGEAADRMVDHLKNVFQQSMQHIAEVRERYGRRETADPDAPDVTDLTDVVQTINELEEGTDPFRHRTPPPASPVPPAAPLPPDAPVTPPTTGMVPVPEPEAPRGSLAHRRVDTEIDDDDSASSQRILRRQGHLPAGKARKVGMSLQEIGELRAIKELLIQKGIITREEIAEQQAASMRATQAD